MNAFPWPLIQDVAHAPRCHTTGQQSRKPLMPLKGPSSRTAVSHHRNHGRVVNDTPSPGSYNDPGARARGWAQTRAPTSFKCWQPTDLHGGFKSVQRALSCCATRYVEWSPGQEASSGQTFACLKPKNEASLHAYSMQEQKRPAQVSRNRKITDPSAANHRPPSQANRKHNQRHPLPPP